MAEAARNIACTGARPLGITDCLNFGNPEKPEVFFQFREACRGIADACRAFDTPVTGGNVSFYNESPTGAVDPTPTVGMVGLLERVADRVPSHFAAPGDEIVILGATRGELGGSAYWAELRDFIGGRPAARWTSTPSAGCSGCWWRRPGAGCSARRTTARRAGCWWRWPRRPSAAPTRAAGSAPAVDLTAYAPGVPPEGLLYGEDGARAVVSAAPGGRRRRSLALAGEHGVPAHRAGQVGAAGRRAGTSGGRSAVHVGHRRAAPDLFHGDSPTDAASGRGPLGGRVRHVRHHRRLRDA